MVIQLAQQFATLLPLQLFNLPFALGAFDLERVYLTQRQQDPVLAWLAKQILT
jgi:hypothetical protein